MKIDLRKLPKAQLGFVKPMLAKSVDELPSGKQWIYELKLDGYRALVMKQRRAVTIFSRRGNNLNSSFAPLVRAFSFLPNDTIVDGELVVLALHFYVFDLLAYEGRDLRKLPLGDRRVLLEDHALQNMRDPVRLSPVFEATPKQLIAAAKQAGLEGVVGKRADSRYESGERSGAWVKYKTNKGQELVVGGYKPDTNGFEYLLVGYYEGTDLIFIAKIRNGFTLALRRDVAKHFAGLRTSQCPFDNLPERASARRGEAITADVMKKIKWLRPKLVAHIEFTEWTKGNHLRHSRFVALRDDKTAADVVKEYGR